MRHLIKVLIIFTLVLVSPSLYSQHLQEVGDSIEISLDGYKDGLIQWQCSDNGIKWVDLLDEKTTQLKTIATATRYYRARIYDCCSSYYSDTTRIFVPKNEYEYVDLIGQYLASDELKGRYPGSHYDSLSVSFISEIFKKNNLLPFENNQSFYESFVTENYNPLRDKILTFNVIGVKLGSDPILKNDIVLISGHYDHLGLNSKNEILNGADDNVSAVTVVSLLARKFKDVNLKRTLIFITPGAEEFGCLGTKAFLKAHTLKSIKGVFNYDLIGRLRNDELSIYGSALSQPIMEKMRTLNSDSLNLKYFFNEVFFAGSWSDHAFYYGYPAFGFTTGPESDYHKPSDDWEKINVEGIVKITSLCYRTILQIAND